jgi:hypothetical protein
MERARQRLGEYLGCVLVLTIRWGMGEWVKNIEHSTLNIECRSAARVSFNRFSLRDKLRFGRYLLAMQ